MITGLILCFTVAYLEAVTVNKPASCSFPFLYKGQSYDECIKLDAPAYWCSVEKVYNGSFSYCKVDESDEIGDEHFLALIKQAEQHTARLVKLQSGLGSATSQCSACIESLKAVSTGIVEQTAIFMDQNKRLQGLKSQHNSLNEAIDRLNKYYQLRRCRQTEVGAEYLGRVSVTVSGYQCQEWSSQTPQQHEYTSDDQYPENRVDNAKNYCRNPGLDSGPWCYTKNPKKRFEYCHIPKCNVDCNTDAKVNSTLPLCEEYASTSCSNNSIFYNNNCYKAIISPMDYYAAEKTCQDLKGHLVSVHSTSENSFLVQNVFPGSNSFFIGFSDEVKEGALVWSDNTKSDYQHFYSGEPNGNRLENCVEVGRYPGRRESWNDSPCSDKKGFVCKMSLNK